MLNTDSSSDEIPKNSTFLGYSIYLGFSHILGILINLKTFYRVGMLQKIGVLPFLFWAFSYIQAGQKF